MHQLPFHAAWLPAMPHVPTLRLPCVSGRFLTAHERVSVPSLWLQQLQQLPLCSCSAVFLAVILFLLLF